MANPRSGPSERGQRRAVGDRGTDGRDHGAAGSDRGAPALLVEGITKRFGSGETAITAVDNVSLAVERGSVVGLLGPNGAGKTTLIKCILGTVLPDEGHVEIFGIDTAANRRTAYEDVDSMLEGARNDYWRLTVRENLRYFATIRGVDPDSVAGRHDRLLERLDLVDKADTPVRDLSRGMKQKVSLASVLAGGANLVFLDEPTLGLDVESSRTLRRELRRLAAEEGLTIVLSSHDMATIEDVCDRVVMMAEGRIVADDGVDALLAGAERDLVRVVSADIDEAVVGELREQFGVRSVEALDGRTAVEVGATGDRLYALMEHLQAAGVTVEDIRTVQPDLEEIFVDLTGMDDGHAGSTGGRADDRRHRDRRADDRRHRDRRADDRRHRPGENRVDGDADPLADDSAADDEVDAATERGRSP